MAIVDKELLSQVIQNIPIDELLVLYRAECHPLFARDPDIRAATIAGLEAVRSRILKEIESAADQDV